MEDDLVLLNGLDATEQRKFCDAVQSSDELSAGFDSFAHELLDLEQQCISSQPSQDKIVGQVQQQIADDFSNAFRVSLCPSCESDRTEMAKVFNCFAAYYLIAGFIVGSFLTLLESIGSGFSGNQIDKWNSFVKQIPAWLEKIGGSCGIGSEMCENIIRTCQAND